MLNFWLQISVSPIWMQFVALRSFSQENNLRSRRPKQKSPFALDFSSLGKTVSIKMRLVFSFLWKVSIFLSSHFYCLLQRLCPWNSQKVSFLSVRSFLEVWRWAQMKECNPAGVGGWRGGTFPLATAEACTLSELSLYFHVAAPATVLCDTRHQFCPCAHSFITFSSFLTPVPVQIMITTTVAKQNSNYVHTLMHQPDANILTSGRLVKVFVPSGWS